MGWKVLKTVLKEKKMTEWTKEEKEKINSVYGCELIYEHATIDQIKDTSVPNDAYLIYYEVESNSYVDVCRGRKKVDIFDLYYDKFGPGSVKKIDFGYGRTNPRLWGDKNKDIKKKK
jgi:hypothetical protein